MLLLKQKKIIQIPVLTSLRFFAAFFILLYHSSGQFGFARHAFSDSGLTSFMAFFFVLSGFILVHCYPAFEGGWKEIKHFYFSRIARVWPLHVATLFLAILIVPYNVLFELQPELWKKIGSFFMNIFLLHAWIPQSWSYTSYNEISWSISVELFFYLLFPFLLPKLRKRPWIILSSLFSFVLIMIFLCFYLKVPSYFESKGSFNASSLFHMNPLLRLFEFTCGMYAGVLAESWRAKKITEKVSLKIWTILELSALSLFSINIISLSRLADWIGFGSGAPAWVVHSGAVPSAFLVVLLFSLSRGYVTKFLEMPFWVLLGSCSYSVYLLHNMFLLRLSSDDINPFSFLNIWLQFPAFVFFIVFLSYFSWRFFETPMRKKMTQFFDRYFL